nr:MAG TPA: hypothetical protein [Caudoviricetes sp.]
MRDFWYFHKIHCRHSYTLNTLLYISIIPRFLQS